MAKTSKFYTISRHPDSYMNNFLIIKKFQNSKMVSRHLIIEKDLPGWQVMLSQEGYEEKN